jgi:predicted Zn-dependent protease
MRADTEAELGVMAHEIAHVARHGTKNATKGALAQLDTIPLIHAWPRRLGRLRDL